MPERKNPFVPIYRSVNNGTNLEKYNKIYNPPPHSEYK